MLDCSLTLNVSTILNGKLNTEDQVLVICTASSYGQLSIDKYGPVPF